MDVNYARSKRQRGLISATVTFKLRLRLSSKVAPLHLDKDVILL